MTTRSELETQSEEEDAAKPMAALRTRRRAPSASGTAACSELNTTNHG